MVYFILLLGLLYFGMEHHAICLTLTRIQTVKSQETVLLIVTAAGTSAFTTLHYSLRSFQPIMSVVFQLRLLWLRHVP